MEFIDCQTNETLPPVRKTAQYLTWELLRLITRLAVTLIPEVLHETRGFEIPRRSLVCALPESAHGQTQSICGSNPARWIFIIQMCFHVSFQVSEHITQLTQDLYHSAHSSNLDDLKFIWILFVRKLCLNETVEKTRERSESVTFSSEVPLWTHPCRKIDSKCNTFYMDDMRWRRSRYVHPWAEKKPLGSSWMFSLVVYQEILLLLSF